MPFTLELLPAEYLICRLPAEAPFPTWARGENLLALIRTADELSVVCEGTDGFPDDVRVEDDWRALKVRGPLDFSLVGVLADLAGALAQVDVSIFALSTFDTDYLLVKSADLPAAIEALNQAGHQIDLPSS
jgi:hypothetical protein